MQQLSRQRELSAHQLADVLESGRYQKAEGALGLRNALGEESYCCLGVYAQECGFTKIWENNNMIVGGRTDALPSVLAPDWMMREWKYKPTMYYLIDLNDNTIGDWSPVIEYLRGLP